VQMGDTAVHAFGTQIFVTRSHVAVATGLRDGRPELVGTFTALGERVTCRRARTGGSVAIKPLMVAATGATGGGPHPSRAWRGHPGARPGSTRWGGWSRRTR
jgi:YhfX-like, C-terminal domain